MLSKCLPLSHTTAPHWPSLVGFMQMLSPQDDIFNSSLVECVCECGMCVCVSPDVCMYMYTEGISVLSGPLHYSLEAGLSLSLELAAFLLGW